MTSRLARLGLVATVVVLLLLIPALVLGRPYLVGMFGFGSSGQDTSLVDLRSTEDLRERFNADAGSPRLVLLLSPT